MSTSKFINSSRQLTINPSTSDWLKVLCCFVIAVHHYSQQLHIIQPDCNPILRLFASQGGYTGVAFFFFLSGYGLMKSELKRHLSLKDFLVRRIKKIYIPTVCVTLVWLIISKILNINTIHRGG